MLITSGQAMSASSAIATSHKQNRVFPRGLGFTNIISSAIDAVGQGTAAGFQYMAVKEQAEAPAKQVSEYMKHKGFLERQARADFRRNLIASKAQAQADAAAAATFAGQQTTRQQQIVFIGLGAAVVVGLGTTLWLILRR